MKKEILLEEARKVDFEKLDDRSIVSLMYCTEKLYSYSKKQSRVFAHIFTFLLVLCIMAIATAMCNGFMEAMPTKLRVGLKIATALYGLNLAIRGIKLYIENERYMRMMLQNIKKQRAVMEKRCRNS